MARYVCPSCRPRPLTMRRRFDGVWICARCGDPLRRRTGPGGLSALAGLAGLAGLATVGVAITLVPLGQPWGQQLSQNLAHAIPAHLLEGNEPLAALVGPAGLVGIDRATLFSTLDRADAAWTPRVEVLPDGRTRYHYQRRAGQAQLSLAEIRRLIANPPTFRAEQAAIGNLLGVLERAGVRIQLVQPRKPGAAAEWDPRARTLRIKPRVLRAGSAEFAQVLNHEAIHVAQSCSRGHLRAMPQLLGLDRRLPPDLTNVLSASVYAKAPAGVKRLEEEAYANQHRLDLGARLVRQHCRGAAGPA